MDLSYYLVALTTLFALIGLFFLVLAVSSTKRKKLFAMGRNFLATLLMLSLAALFGTLSISIQGYQALTREDLAATVKIIPTGRQEFTATFIMPDKSEKVFSIAGDQLNIDAHILKWKPIASLLGLHTSFELDRVSGRYASLKDESTMVHTHYSLSDNKFRTPELSPCQQWPLLPR
ncbi:hypothetical protein KKI24_30900 [bacterium]|nr:hypothetical protein [bacterium]